MPIEWPIYKVFSLYQSFLTFGSKDTEIKKNKNSLLRNYRLKDSQ